MPLSLDSSISMSTTQKFSAGESQRTSSFRDCPNSDQDAPSTITVYGKTNGPMSAGSKIADLTCTAELRNKSPEPHNSEDTSESFTKNANDTSNTRVSDDRICTSPLNDRPLSADSDQGASFEELTWLRAGERQKGKRVERYWFECCMCEHLVMSNQMKCT